MQDAIKVLLHLYIGVFDRLRDAVIRSHEEKAY
jgi:hypothetical protein